MKNSTGHLNPIDWRGRMLSFLAIASGSACKNTPKSLPLVATDVSGRWVFLLRPHCQLLASHHFPVLIVGYR